MKKNLKLLSILTLSAGLITAAPVFGAARSIDITESKISLESIDANWKEISDKHTLHTFTNGTDVITVLRYDSDDTLPSPEKSGGKYAAVFQTYYSVGNTVYVVTGSAVNKENMDTVRDIMNAISYPASAGSASSAGSSSETDGSSAKNAEVNEQYAGRTENEETDSSQSYNQNSEERESYDDSVNDPHELYSWDSETNSYIPYQQADGDGLPIGQGEGWYYYDDVNEEYIPW